MVRTVYLLLTSLLRIFRCPTREWGNQAEAQPRAAKTKCGGLFISRHTQKIVEVRNHMTHQQARKGQKRPNTLARPNMAQCTRTREYLSDK